MKAVELYDHQRKAVDKLHNGSVLCGGVGTGKSRVAIQYYVEKEAPRNVYVITTAKKRDSLDWESEAIQHGIGTEASALSLGVITVDSWNNLWKYVDIEDAFFIFDEQRVVGSGAWVKVFLKIAKKNRWLLLSATPGDTWLDYIPVFIANGFYKNRTEFTREHVVYSRFSKFPKVDRFIAVGKLVRLRNSILVDMPYERHTTRVIHEIEVDYNKELFDKVVKDRWHVFEDRPLRDVAELYSVMRKVVNSDDMRLQTVTSLIQKHPKLIVFYNFDYELEMLRTLSQNSADGALRLSENINKRFSSSEKSESVFSETTTLRSCERSTIQIDELSQKSKPLKMNTGFTVAEWNGHKHEPIPKTDSWIYLVQYTAGAEGWNCIETDAIVFYSLTYSYRAYEQGQGRIDRLNTLFDTLHYYVLKSNSYIDKTIWQALRVKRNFNESRDVKNLGKILADGPQKGLQNRSVLE